MTKLSDKITVRLDEELRSILPLMSDNISQFVRQTLREKCGLSNNGEKYPQPLTSGDAWIRYIGSKRLLAPKILKRIPPHKCYVEVFGGAAFVLLQKKYDHRIQEIYNDINGEMANLFWVIQNKFEDFYMKLSWNIRSRAIWQLWKEIDPNSLDCITRAVRYYYLLRASFSGKQDWSSFGMHYERRHDGLLAPPLKILYKVHKRMKRVVIENRSYEQLIPYFDRKETFYYLDPPYETTAEKDHYEFSWSLEEHNALFDSLKQTKGKWLLSYNASERIRDLYSNFYIEEIEVKYGTRPGSQDKKEFLISNYEIREQRNLDHFVKEESQR